MFGALKARLGIGGRNRRYVDVESVRDLEDISDPETTEDETQTKLRDLVAEHPLIAGVFALLGLGILGMVLMWTVEWAAYVLTNPWLHRGVVVFLIFVWSYRKGWKMYRARVSDHDELVLYSGDGVTTYKGAYLDDLPGESRGFIPLKGWRKVGHDPVPYKNADLGAAMVETYRGYQMSDDDAAIIRLQPGSDLAVTDTDYGRRVVQRTAGLRPDPHGQHSSLVAQLPEYDDDRANELADQLESMQQENRDLRGEIQALTRRNKDLKERMNEPIDEEVEKQLENLATMAQVAGGGGRRRSREAEEPRHDFKGAGTIERPVAVGNGDSPDDELEQVEEEVTVDDD